MILYVTVTCIKHGILNSCNFNSVIIIQTGIINDNLLLRVCDTDSYQVFDMGSVLLVKPSKL